MGGENVTEPKDPVVDSGSSPHGRRKPRRTPLLAHGARLIPARAGKTPKNWLSVKLVWAHPRAGGENLSSLADTLTPVGSSPRGRGKRFGAKRGLDTHRLIPARAGKTRTPLG